jgi:hypothetical protein
MKTTLDIDDELLVLTKALAARERKTLSRLVEEGLRLRLSEHAQRSALPLWLAIHRGKGGLVEGVDPRSNRAMLDAEHKGA